MTVKRKTLLQMVNPAVKCTYVYVYNLKSGGENGEVHYCFL